jgi:hypothetical protein
VFFDLGREIHRDDSIVVGGR